MLILGSGPFNRTPITLARVLEFRAKDPKRIDFLRTHPGRPRRAEVSGRPDIVGNIDFPFAETIKPLFEAETGITLFPNAKFGNFWHSIREEEKFLAIEGWVQAQGSRVFLRSTLDLTLALDYNLLDNLSGRYTRIGELERRAKGTGEAEAVRALSDACAESVLSLPYFRRAPFLAAVPSMSYKKFDLPSTIAANIANRVGKTDLTTEFKAEAEKAIPLKAAGIEEKWGVLEKTGLRVDRKLPEGSDVVLIDDKYQSGTTMQYVAMKLQEAGARYIFGISLVKTLRDTDNAT